MSAPATRSVNDLQPGDVINDPEFDQPVEIVTVFIDLKHIVVIGDIKGRRVELVYPPDHEIALVT